MDIQIHFSINGWFGVDIAWTLPPGVEVFHSVPLCVCSLPSIKWWFTCEGMFISWGWMSGLVPSGCWLVRWLPEESGRKRTREASRPPSSLLTLSGGVGFVGVSGPPEDEEPQLRPTNHEKINLKNVSTFRSRVIKWSHASKKNLPAGEQVDRFRLDLNLVGPNSNGSLSNDSWWYCLV